MNASYSAGTDETVKINITTLNRALVVSIGSLVKKGNNIISINQARSIPSGTCLLIMSNGKRTETIKVVKG